MNPLIGRKKELKKLQGLLTSNKSEFVAVYGRRRVGKTFLIRKAFNFEFTFQLTGLFKANRNKQLSQFHAALLQYFPLNYATTATMMRPDFQGITWSQDRQQIIGIEPATDWFMAFRQLMQVVEQQKTPDKKVIFLDELPWLDTHGSGFLSALEHFWNSWASARSDIILIVCGSA